eukprot:comp21380_c0_seq1/m.46109 comp21380_c0_seq1/g.46109  ORF comp21380_c0_seq1/g.46109 comp21380_c0_seq1/m.46109 type:complete len:938 (+) comp21380_c0_seq1:129-2942(+)
MFLVFVLFLVVVVVSVPDFALGVRVRGVLHTELNTALRVVRDRLGHHRDAVRDRAHRHAQRAARAVVGDVRKMCVAGKGDCLVARVIACHVALAAVDAQIIIHKRNNLLLVVQLVVVGDLVKRLAKNVRNTRDLARLHKRRTLELLLAAQRRVLELVLADLPALLLIVSKLGQMLARGLAELLLGRALVELGRSLAVPLAQILARELVQVVLESHHIVVNHSKVLVLNRRADLDNGRSAVDELQRNIRRVAAASGHHRVVRERVADLGHRLERNGTGRVTRDTTIGRALLSADRGPCRGINLETHQTRDGVDRSHTSRAAFLGRARNVDNVGHIRRELGKERNLDRLAHPLADVVHKRRILAARKTHAALTHAVRARKVELERIAAARLGKNRKLGPVDLVVRTHDRGNDHAVREVALELLACAAPVGRSLLGNELNVEERTLARTKLVASGLAAHNARGHIRHKIAVEREGLGDRKAPAGLERAADHRSARARGRRRKTERIRELDASHGDRGVHKIHLSEELGQLRRSRHGCAAALLDQLVDVPRCGLAVVGRLDRGAVANEITASKHPVGMLALARGHIDVGVAVVVELQRRICGAGLRRDLRAERRDRKVALEQELGLRVLLERAVVLLLEADHLETIEAAVALHNTLGQRIRDELAGLALAELDFLRHGTHLAESAAEDNGHALGAAAERRGGAVKGSVAGTEHNNVAVELGQIGLAVADTGLGGLGDLRQEALGGVEAREILVEGLADLRMRETGGDKDGSIAVLLERVDGEALAELLAVLDLDAEIEHELDLKVDDRVGQTELRDLRGRETSREGVLLKHGHVGVAETRKEGAARNARWACANNRNLAAVRLRKLVERRQARVSDLRNVHLLEHLARKLLQTTNVDWAFLGGGKVAAAHAQVAGRTHHAAGQAVRVVAEDRLGSSVVVLV